VEKWTGEPAPKERGVKEPQKPEVDRGKQEERQQQGKPDASLKKKKSRGFRGLGGPKETGRHVEGSRRKT